MIVGVLTTCHTQYSWDRCICVFYLIEQHSKVLLHTWQVLYMWTLCDSTNIKAIVEFVPHVSGDGFSGGSDTYLQFRDTHTPCLLKLCIPPSNGIVRRWLFPEFGAELPLDNCTPTIILNNPVQIFKFLIMQSVSKDTHTHKCKNFPLSCKSDLVIKQQSFFILVNRRSINEVTRWAEGTCLSLSNQCGQRQSWGALATAPSQASLAALSDILSQTSTTVATWL